MPDFCYNVSPMKQIVTIGGGSGSYVVLSGLKRIPDVYLTSLVTMADDGGSTGVLRKNWGVRPSGDARQALVALSGKEFLNHRLGSGPFKGHKTGNIIIAALEKITGDFTRGLRLASFIFGTKGKILPITGDDAVLCLRMKDAVIEGESKIDKASLQTTPGEDSVEEIFYKTKTTLSQAARESIHKADTIIICPGNLYCSILPNFIVDGFKEAILKSPAKVILVLNLVNKEGHTMGWSARQYLSVIEKYLGKPTDYILVNNGVFTSEQRERYLAEAGEGIFIKNDLTDPRAIETDLVSHDLLQKDHTDTVERSLIRHSKEKFREAIEGLF